MLPVVIYEKPTPHIGVPDWYSKLSQNHQTNEARTKDSSNLRQEARKLQNETEIRTKWDNHHTNDQLQERMIELNSWKDTLEFYLDRLGREQNELKHQKASTERLLDFLEVPLSTVKECITIRDDRRKHEITLDNVEEELKKELDLVEKSKFTLTERCRESWEKINDLQELKMKLHRDVVSKREALTTDREQFGLTERSSVITMKPDPTRLDKMSITPDCWLENCQTKVNLSEELLQSSWRLRQVLFETREKVKNDLKAQRDQVEYLLRRRIYDTQRVRNEVNWHQIKMEDEMRKLSEEISKLQVSFEQKSDPVKLTETRLENRYYRSIFKEVVSDKPEESLKSELLSLQLSRKDLSAKLRDAKATYNALQERKYVIDVDLEDKNHSLDVDTRCLNARKPLRIEKYFGPEENTERNVELIVVKDELPSTQTTHD